MTSLSRKIQREQLKKALKEAEKNPNLLKAPLNVQHNQDVINLLTKEVESIKKTIGLIDNHIWMLVETLADKNLLNWADIHKVEQKYIKKEALRKEKIQIYRASDKTVPEILEELQESPDLKGYERLNIHPIRDLNMNPYEVANYIKEKHPNLTKEEYLRLGKAWDLELLHFNFSDAENQTK